MGMGWELQPSETPCVGTMMGMSMKCLPQKSWLAMGWYLAASNCPCCPVLVLLASLPLCASVERDEIPLEGECTGKGLLECSTGTSLTGKAGITTESQLAGRAVTLQRAAS